MTTPIPRAVMFDMTGTLHPQAHIAAAAMAATQVVLAERPGVDPADCAPVLGRTMRESFVVHGAAGFYLMRDVLAEGHRRAWAELGVPVDEELLARVVRTFETTLVSVIEPYPSAIGVLTTIRSHGIATAIVSVNDEQLLQDSVDACGLRPYFDVVLSSEAAGSCKPRPGMFEQAMAALGVRAEDTVFVGDMPELDIVGARRVGMRTVLTTEDAGYIGTIEDVGDEGVADVTIASLAELPAVLGLAPTRRRASEVLREAAGRRLELVGTPEPSPVPVVPVFADGDVDGALAGPAAEAAGDLASRLGVPVAAVTVRSAVCVTWSDGSLGCPRPGMVYPQVMVDGAVFELSVGGSVYRYHSGGRRSPFPCSEPLAHPPRRS